MSAINLSLPKELLYTAQFDVSLCQQLQIEEKALFTQSFGKAVQKHGKSIQRLTKSSYHECCYRNIINNQYVHLNMYCKFDLPQMTRRV